MATTKLAIHKHIFDRQVRIEMKASRYHTHTEHATAVKSATHDAVNKLADVKLVCPDGLSELMSTQLWGDLEGSDCWNLPRWIPGDHALINITYGLSHIHLDFVHRTFDIVEVALPKHIGTHPLPLKLRCFETGADAFVGITFLAEHLVKVHVTALSIVQVDSRCNILALMRNVVELVGFCMEDTDGGG
jgi:hypothetical protein